MILPEIYTFFYQACQRNMPAKLLGTDLYNGEIDLYKEAVVLLRENGISNFLKEEDVVFMMHQGYIFWYFSADGNPDPIVYGFREGNLQPDQLQQLSNFIKDYL